MQDNLIAECYNNQDMLLVHINDVRRDWLAYCHQEQATLDFLLTEYLGNHLWHKYDPEAKSIEAVDAVLETLHQTTGTQHVSKSGKFTQEAKIRQVDGAYHAVWVCNTDRYQVVHLAYNGCSAHGTLDMYFIRELNE